MYILNILINSVKVGKRKLGDSDIKGFDFYETFQDHV